MTVFIILSPSDTAALGAAVEGAFPGNHFKISPGQYAVSGHGITAQEVYTKLQIPEGTTQHVVFTSAGHWGWHRKDLWEWLTAKSSSS